MDHSITVLVPGYRTFIVYNHILPHIEWIFPHMYYTLFLVSRLNYLKCCKCCKWQPETQDFTWPLTTYFFESSEVEAQIRLSGTPLQPRRMPSQCRFSTFHSFNVRSADAVTYDKYQIKQFVVLFSDIWKLF